MNAAYLAVDVVSPEFIDRVPHLSWLTRNTFKSPNANMATFIVIRHPVTKLATVFTIPINLTNDLLIFHSEN